MQQLRAKAKSLTFPPLSIARYSFIQLSEQGRQWRERKCPIFETVTKRDSNPGSTLPLRIAFPHKWNHSLLGALAQTVDAYCVHKEIQLYLYFLHVHRTLFLPVLLAGEQVERVLSPKKRVIIQYLHGRHPVRVEVSRNLSTTNNRHNFVIEKSSTQKYHTKDTVLFSFSVKPLVLVRKLRHINIKCIISSTIIDYFNVKLIMPTLTPALISNCFNATNNSNHQFVHQQLVNTFIFCNLQKYSDVHGTLNRENVYVI